MKKLLLAIACAAMMGNASAQTPRPYYFFTTACPATQDRPYMVTAQAMSFERSPQSAAAIVTLSNRADGGPDIQLVGSWRPEHKVLVISGRNINLRDCPTIRSMLQRTDRTIIE